MGISGRNRNGSFGSENAEADLHLRGSAGSTRRALRVSLSSETQTTYLNLIMSTLVSVTL
jgi:hypothetical protein